MTFLSGRRYAGVTYNMLACQWGIDRARASGIRALYTRFGMPPNLSDACEWIELPDDPLLASRVVWRLIGRLPVRQAAMRGKAVIAGSPCDVRVQFERGGNIIAGR